MHSLFESVYYLPQQVWLFIFYYFIVFVSTTLVLKSKFKKIPTVLLSLLILYIFFTPFHFDNMPFWATQFPMFSIIVAELILYKDKLLVKLISSIINICLIFCSDFFSYLLVIELLKREQNYLNEPYVYLVSSILIVLLCSLNVLIWNKFYNKDKEDIKRFFKYNVVFFLVFIVIELLFVTFWIIDHRVLWEYLPYGFKNANQTFMFMYIILFVVLDCIIIYFTKSSSSYEKIKAKNEMLEYQNKLQTEYYEKMLENYDKTAKLRHDINNLVQVINVQLSQNTVESHEKAKEIANGISDIMESTKSHKFCNNRIVNAVLFDKTTIAEKDGIKIIDNIILDDNISITDFDICRIFINLLDNSINALKNYNDNDKIIFISCKKDNNNIYIKCENKFSENNKKFKKNSELHGYGLKIVKDIAQKYDGDLIIETQNYTFSALVVLKTL